ncbi:gpW family head-tail joining protein [Thioalkalivibrio sp. ALJ8]|uniref:gpW family head-tail joining protein n=1 Tax=Thioalkalivibrio sp. ALJ8 TaxID=1158757 RepID=UPI00036A95ED|nr:gpW family head-tail joining protein [Thioalkalivibrio sp. ALJ8]
MDAGLFQHLGLSELRKRRDEALDGLHALNTGKRSVTFRYGDRQVQYSEPARLEAYVQALSGAIRAKESGRSGRGPITLGVG